jgi:hypothetical protein
MRAGFAPHDSFPADICRRLGTCSTGHKIHSGRGNKTCLERGSKYGSRVGVLYWRSGTQNFDRPLNFHEEPIGLMVFIDGSLFCSEPGKVGGNDSIEPVFEEAIRDEMAFSTMETPSCSVAWVASLAGSRAVIDANPTAPEHGRPAVVEVVFGGDTEAVVLEFLGRRRAGEVTVFWYVDLMIIPDMVFYRCMGPEDVDEESMDGVSAIEHMWCTAVMVFVKDKRGAYSVARGDSSVLGEHFQAETQNSRARIDILSSMSRAQSYVVTGSRWNVFDPPVDCATVCKTMAFPLVTLAMTSIVPISVNLCPLSSIHGETSGRPDALARSLSILARASFCRSSISSATHVTIPFVTMNNNFPAAKATANVNAKTPPTNLKRPSASAIVHWQACW